MADTHIRIRGARTHNLKNIDLDLPKNSLTVLTGLSGSGKSSLAFDTIYAEGQRRYVESLSSYARQFLGLMEKPDVDHIDGLSPAISIDQKSAGHNPRSTVGTVTEVFDYLRLLFARAGHPRSPSSGKLLRSQTVQEIVDSVAALATVRSSESLKVMLLAPVVKDRKGTYEELFGRYLSMGFVRARVNGEIFNLEEKIKLDRYAKHSIDIVVDRLVVRKDSASDSEFLKRLTDSVETCLRLGEQELLVHLVDAKEDLFYSEKLVDPSTGESFPEVEPHSFSFNSPHGACPTCHGLGMVREINPDLILDMELSVSEGAIVPWARMAEKGDSWYMQILANVAKAEGFSLNTPLNKLNKKFLTVLLNGTGDKKYKVKFERSGGGKGEWDAKFEGIVPNLTRRYEQTDSDSVRHEIEEYMEERSCEACKGLRLKRPSLMVTLGGLNIIDVCRMSIAEAVEWNETLESGKRFKPMDSLAVQLLGLPKINPHDDGLGKKEQEIAKQVFKEIKARLGFLCSVGLGYLSLDRSARSLSGGESQRIRLASQIGTGLSGVLYVLDEPSIGLHQRDNDRLLATLRNLRDLGNTVLVVEHDSDTIESADWVVDIGPGAGEHGGRVVFAGLAEDIKKSADSLTGQYLSGVRNVTQENIRQEIEALQLRPAESPLSGDLVVKGASHNNLKNVTLKVPLGKFVCVTGVSGSGKSSLVNEVLAKLLLEKVNGARAQAGKYTSIEGWKELDKAVIIDQSPIGRTPRSNPATYTGVFTDIRTLFSMTTEAKVRGYAPGRFSFNVKGGRCENCQGDGLIKIEMQFLPDVYVTCEICKGNRYNRDTLQIHFKGKTISELLEMTVEEGAEFFKSHPSIYRRLKTLEDVGLGYIRLGQSATTLSGGEAQRIKLAAELSRRSTGRSFYILDEPSTGLHFEDVRRLLVVLHSLVHQGNTVLVIEHNLDIVKTADWVIDLGPEGGDAGGKILMEGTVEDLAKQKDSHTGYWLAKHLEQERSRKPKQIRKVEKLEVKGGEKKRLAGKAA